MATSSTTPQLSTHDSTFHPPNWKQIIDSIFEVYKPATGCYNMEIVFIHGFRTNSSKDAYYRTWMKGDDSGSWLDTWLVECFPRARIISVSYDSSLTMSDNSGHEDMYLFGESLVQCLVDVARVGQSCPVVLVGHCVGGLVLKQICLWAHKFATTKIDCGTPRYLYVNFLKYVKGGFFYSTPHLGSDLPLRGELDQHAPIARSLEVLHRDSGRRNHEFTKLRSQYGWRTFGVAAPNKTRKRKLLSNLEDEQTSFTRMDIIPTSFFVVGEGSARVDMDGFVSIPEEEFEVELQRSLGLYFTITNLDHRVDRVIKKLEMEKAEQINLVLVGMDGIGKSTLAKQVLVSIGQQFDYTCFLEFEKVPQREINRELERLVALNLRYQNGEQVYLHDGEKPWNRLRKKKLLMIIDDVESEHQITSFLRWSLCGEGSRLVITSSKQNWPRDFIVHSIPFLSLEASLELFKAHVDESVLRSIPEEMVSKVMNECDGLPLTLEVIGEYLRDANWVDVWAAALERLQTADSLDGLLDENVVWKKLRVSFERFAEPEKNVFLDIATFDDLPSEKQYDLRIWKNAWSGNRKWDVRVIDTALLNLARRSFLQIQGGKHEQVRQSLNDSSTIRIHKQLRHMGKWISAPSNDAPSKWRGLWRLSDVKEVLLLSQSTNVSKMEAQLEDKPQTEVLSISMGQESSYSFADSNSQVPGSVVHWSSIGNMEKLRLLKISNMRMNGSESDLRLPTSLTLLDMENCTSAWKRSDSEWTVDNHSWPIREEDVEVLHSLSVMMLRNCNVVQLPENFHMLRRLRILRIETGGMSMRPLPSTFGFLPALEHLDLRAPLENLPSSLQLPSLRSLVLDELHIQVFPNPITRNQLTALTSLDLVDLRYLAELPDSFGGLVSLQRLRVEDCPELKNLPGGFGKLHRLEKLEILLCRKLETLCESFCGLRTLQYLRLHELPQLKTLPTRFGYLPSLEDVTLSWCRLLKELPESFVELTSIQRIRIGECRALETLWSNLGPSEFGSALQKLKSVPIAGCEELKRLPSSLEQLSSLTNLEVTRCSKLRVPESVWRLTSLSDLSLEYGVSGAANVDGSGTAVLPSFGQVSELYDFPTGISGTLQGCYGQNSSLESFSYDVCTMAVSDPHPIAQLRALKHLRISNYPRLGWLLQSVGYLTSLTKLRLQSCSDLVTIPEAIGGLFALGTLEIDDCKNLVGLPESIGKLYCLYYLKIESCENLVNLPDSIGQLPSLAVLEIHDCGNLMKLPDSIGQLPSLAVLEIHDCGNLVNLPESIGQLPSLQDLSIDGCENLVNLPESIRPLPSRRELEIDDY